MNLKKHLAKTVYDMKLFTIFSRVWSQMFEEALTVLCLGMWPLPLFLICTFFVYGEADTVWLNSHRRGTTNEYR